MPGIVCNIDAVVQAYDDLTARQLPFATARALTLTAQDAQSAIRAGMPRSFTIRNAWSQRGIIIQPASVWKLPLTSAVMVGDIWSYLNLQDAGGAKTPTASQHLAVPEDIRRSPTQILRGQLRPKAILQRKDVFIKDLGAGSQAIFQRLAGDKLKLLYVLTPRATVKPRLGLEETAQAVGEARWQINFAGSLEAALMTAK